jgi:WD40 repeat protein
MTWQENGRAGGSLWRSPDLDLLQRFHQRAGIDMTPLQVEFFNASVEAERVQQAAEAERLQTEKDLVEAKLTAATEKAQAETKLAVANEEAAKKQNQQRQFWVRVLGAVSVITSSLAIFSMYQAQKNSRERVEQLAKTSQALLATQPVMAEVNAIAAIGLADKPFVRFPFLNDEMSISAQQNLLAAVRSNREKNQFLLKGAVRSVAISPDGTKIVSGGNDTVRGRGGTDYVLRLWNIKTGKQIGAPFFGHENSIWSVAFSPNGEWIVSGSKDKTLRLWDVRTHKQIGVLTGHEASVLAVAVRPDGKQIVSGSRDKTLRLWDISIKKNQSISKPSAKHKDNDCTKKNQSISKPLANHKSNDWSVAWSSKYLGEHKGNIWSVAFSCDGQKIVSGSGDKTLQLWDTKGNKISPPFHGHSDEVYSVAFSRDGEKIVSGSKDKTLRLWDADGKQIDEPFIGHNKEVKSVAFSSDGMRVLSGSSDNTLRLWNTDTHQQIGQPLTGHEDEVYSAIFSPDGKQIISGGDDEKLRLWDNMASLYEPWYGHTNAVYSVAFSPDGQKIVSGSADNTLRLWDANGKPVGQPFKGHLGTIYSVAFSNGQRIVSGSGSGDNTLRLWDTKGKQIGKPLEGHLDAVYSVAFSRDGQKIVSASWDNSLKVWNANTRKIIDTLGKPLESSKKKNAQDELHSVAFSPDGKQIVSGSRDHFLRLWDPKIDIHHPIGTLTGHNDEVWMVAFSPSDGKTIVSGSNDKTLRLWDASTLQQIGQGIGGHDKAVYSVAFSPISPKGEWIVSGSKDKTLRLWNAKTGQPVGSPLVGHEGAVRSVAFSPDGNWIVSGSDDNTLRLWPVDLVKDWKKLLRTACGQLRNHSILTEPKTHLAKEAKQTCENYGWKP